MDYAISFKNEIINNPDLKKENEELNSVSLEIKNLEDQKASTYDEFVESHP